MAKPLFLVENIFSDVQFPAHVVTASSAAAGAEVWRVATGRRSARDRWTPASANQASWISVDCGAPRTVDMVVLDRGHNLAGRVDPGDGTLLLQCSADGQAWNQVLATDVPAASLRGTPASAGALTPEGAWIRRFPPVAARWWRIVLGPLGPGVRPVVVGLWLGRSWSPEMYMDLPYGDDSVDLEFDERRSGAGWRGTTTPTRVRAGDVRLRLRGDAEYEEAEYHVGHHFWSRRPMWILYDADRAERAVLGAAPAGRYGWEVREGWSYRQAQFAWAEHEPRAS